MKKLFLFLILALFLPMTSHPAMANDENPTIEKEVQVNVDEIKLRPALEIEQAVMEYMLAFEAYQSARKSSDPEVRGKMVQYMKQYREAYARFLDMMREDKLYEPQKPKNPAGRYNRKHQQQTGHKRQWASTAAQEKREKVKKLVESGAKPEEIRQTILVSLPSEPMSVDPSINQEQITITEDVSDDDDEGSDGKSGGSMKPRPTSPTKPVKPHPPKHGQHGGHSQHTPKHTPR